MVSDQNSPLAQDNVANLNEPIKSKSPLEDSLSRLARNRAALIGGVIVIVIILISIFAPRPCPSKL